MHTTDYTNTFIEIADDCKADVGMMPPEKNEKTIARIQYEMIQNNPYKYTSDEVLFTVFAERNNIDKKDYDKRREEFFSKGQACLRSSPLGKTYGWGIHYNSESKIAIYAKESEEYIKFKNDKKLNHLKAMKSKR